MTRALFIGDDLKDHIGLWVTDGTAAGTYELNVPGAFSLTLNRLIAVGHVAIFYDDNSRAIWVTDGTPVGTTEIGTIPSVVFVSDMTVVGNNVFFVSNFDLWVTNGTSLSLVDGPIDVRPTIPPPVFVDPNPSHLHALGSHLIYNARGGLFITDVTGAGKTAISGRSIAGDATVFGRNLLFNGTTDNSEYGLWATDGTAAGTHLI